LPESYKELLDPQSVIASSASHLGMIMAIYLDSEPSLVVFKAITISELKTRDNLCISGSFWENIS